ncbi:DNA repair protein rad50 [Gonapodya sp. JEL0774]|nr:DNA repair protein rad50 [Gonapodya sp. JEL0774]
MDAEIPTYLGINRAILENVIFCHQEDSNWPLSEPGSLKKKFDEIFEATRYTKVLDNIKVLRKAQKEVIALDRQELGHLKENKDKAARVNRNYQDACTRIAAHQSRQVDLEVDLKAVAQDLSQIMNRISECAKMESSIRDVEKRKIDCERQVQQTKDRMEVMVESEDDLRAMLSLLQEESGDLENSREELVRKIKGHEQDLRIIEQEKSRRLTDKGRWQAELEAHNRRLTDRTKTISELALKHSFPGFSHTPLLQADVDLFITKLSKELSEVEKKADETRRQMKEKENTIIAEKGEIGNSLSQFQERKRGALKQIESNGNKVGLLQEKFSGLKAFSEEEIHLAETELKEETALASLDFDTKLEDLNRRLRAQEVSVTTLSDTLARLNSQSGTQNKLSLKHGDRRRKKQNLTECFQKALADFGHLLLREPTMESFESDVDNLIKSQDQVVRAAQQKVNRLQQELSSWETKLSMARQALQSKEEDLRYKKQKLFDVIGNTEFDARLREKEMQVSNCKEEAGTLKGAENVYARFIRKFQEKHVCPLCNRAFSDKQAEERFARNLENTRAKAPESYKATLTELQQFEDEWERLRILASVAQDVKVLEQRDIPEERVRIEEAEANKALAVEQVEKATAEVRMAQSLEKNLQLLRKNVDEMTRLSREIVLLDDDIAKLTDDLDGVGSEKTVDDVKRELDSARDKCKNLQQQIERLHTEFRSRQNDKNSRSERFQALQKRFDDLQFGKREHDSIKREIASLKENNAKLDKELRDAKFRIDALQPRLAQVELALDSHRKEMTNWEGEIMTSLNNVQSSITRMKSMEQEISRFGDSGIQDLLRNVDVELESTEARSNAHGADLRRLTDELSMLDKKKVEDQLALRRIEDNLQVKRLEKEAENLASQLRLLSQEFRSVDRRSFDQQYIQLKKKQDQFLEERAGIAGETKQLEDRRNQLHRELETDYKDVEDKYRTQLVKLKTEEMADSDLSKYAKALDEYVVSDDDSQLT